VVDTPAEQHPADGKLITSVGIFARPPVSGQVKTRLIPDLGASKATRIYRHCLEHTLNVCRNSDLRHQLFLTDQSDDEIFQGEDYLLQQEGDLGIRMFKALELMLTVSKGAIIVGSDCIDLSCRHLHQAANAIDSHELVLLPAEDGGYALIGCSQIDIELFNNVQWSSEQVLEQTLTNANKLNYRTCLLETVRDIDTLHDLKHYPDLLALID
jgi:rSAM/selenodomain-associated transferase 1